jgi:hypothetical protein
MARSAWGAAALGCILYGGFGVVVSAPADEPRPSTAAAPADQKPPKPPAYLDAEQADADYPRQGEYVGRATLRGTPTDIGVQVIALGDGKFHAVCYVGGLPGAGWDGETKMEADGETVEGHVVFKHEGKEGRLHDGLLDLIDADGKSIGRAKKTERQSPTLGAKPPSGAVVLFDGSSPAAFKNGRSSPEGWLMEGADTLEAFGDCTLHLEFRLPYMPTARGQGRANSGCYLQSRYEVQILDSFGLAGLNNECGGIYTIKDPDVNMCLPPLAWQTYDIDFTAARFDAAGAKTADARLTVRHNGVVVQNDVAVGTATRAAPLKEGPAPGPLHLQNHGNPVRFRNIWLVRK